MSYRVVCISRDVGAGGEDVGRAVASQLGFRYVDEEIVRRVAEESGAKGSAFAPVIVEETPSCAEAPIAPAAHAERSRTIEIAIGIARVWVPPWIDPATLTAVLRAVWAAT